MSTEEDYGTSGDDIQNPDDWFGNLYAYATATNTVTFQLDELATKGFTEAGYHKTTGDVRQAYHGIIDKLYSIYDAKEGTSGFNMPDHMKMGKAEVLDAANQKKTTVYTFSIEQSQNVTGGFTSPATSGNASYIDENNA